MDPTNRHRHDDPDFRARVDALYEAVWPGLVGKLRRAADAGADWYRVSTPFVRVVGGQVVAHAGVLSIPLVLDGERVTVAGIHAVGTHPGHRGRGHMRATLREALAHASALHATQQLSTEVPGVFRGHGFRSLPQHRFLVDLPRPAAPGFAPVDLDDADAMGRLRDLLAARTPVSHRLGVVEPGWLLLINEVLQHGRLARLRYDAQLDVAVVVEQRAGELRLLDLIARELPPLEEVLARLAGRAERAALYFTPDRFEGLAVRGVEPAWPGDHVMARGPYAPERGGQPFVLPPLAHC